MDKKDLNISLMDLSTQKAKAKNKRQHQMQLQLLIEQYYSIQRLPILKIRKMIKRTVHETKTSVLKNKRVLILTLDKLSREANFC